MPRPVNPNPKIRLHINLQPEVYARCFILVHDNKYVQGFAPGAFSDLVHKALDFYLNPVNHQKEQA